MKRKDDYKNNLKGAFASTCVAVILLFITATDSKMSESEEILTLVCMAVVVPGTIWTWIRGTRQYIDHRLKEIEKTDLSEKIIEE